MRETELKRVNDVIADYPGEWVAVEVVEYDSSDISGDKDFGRIVAHSVDEGEVWEAIRGHRYLAAVAYSGPQVEPGYVLAL